MKYALKNISAEELSFVVNKIKMDKNTRIEIRPQFSRAAKNIKDNLWISILEMKVESSENEPKPFNMKVRLVGAFEAEGVDSELDKADLVNCMTETLYPYLRTAVTSLTSTAFIQPWILPLSSIVELFPDAAAPATDTLS